MPSFALALMVLAFGAAPLAGPAEDDATAGGADDAAEIAAPAAPDVRPIYLRGPERLRMQGRVELLTVADFNGDGRPDFAAFNPATNLLVVWYSTADADRRSEEFRLEDDGDHVWRERRIVLSHRVTALAAADFNGDGKIDLAYASQTEDGGLILQGHDGLEDQAEPLPVPARQVVAADLDGDGSVDLLVGSKAGLTVLRQGARGLEIAHRLDSSAEPTERMTLHDLDGDGKPDVLFADPQDRTNVLVRFGLANGSFGPEHRHRLGDHGAISTLPGGRITWLDPTTRAITVSALRSPDRALGADRLDFGDPENLPLPGEHSGSRLSIALSPSLGGGDHAEAFVSMNRAAEVLRLHRDGSGHLAFERIPSFAGVTRLEVLPAGADATFGDGGGVLYQLSEGEKVLAHSSLASAATAREFPRPVSTEHTPLAFAAGPFDAELPVALWIAYRVDDDEDEDLTIGVFTPGDAPSEVASIDLEDSFDANPRHLIAADLNNDGHGDVLVFFEFNDPRLYLGGAGGDFTLFEPRGGLARGLLTNLKPLDVAVGDVDADGEQELVIARDNFVRVYRLAPDGEVTIKHQFNPSTRGRTLSAPLLVDLDGDPNLEIIVTQVGGDRLLGFDLDAPSTQREMPATKLEPLAIAHADVTGDGRGDLVVLADKRVAVLAGGGGRRTFSTLSRTLTNVSEGLFGRVATGQLEGPDGPPILMAVEARENALEFFEVSADGDLVSRYRFKVFNQPGSMDERRLRRTEAEPRDVVVHDVDGDGRPDLIALAHENLLIYRGLDGQPDS